jgi:hypothetical protein
MAVQPPKTITQPLPGKWGRGRPSNIRPSLITQHIQVGKGNVWGYFNDENVGDSTIWIPQTGDNLYRYLQDSDTPWTNGFWTEPINHANPTIEALYKLGGTSSNPYVLTIEHEGFPENFLTASQIELSARQCAYWCDVWQIPCDRNHIVGHYEVGEHKNCPGDNFPFDKIIARAQEILRMEAVYWSGDVTQPFGSPNDWHCVATDKWVNNDKGFLDFWRKNGQLAAFGYPVSGARPKTGDTNVIEQYFERGRFEFHIKENKIMLGLVGSELLAKL